MGSKLDRYFIPVAIGFAPFLLFVLNWDAERMSFPMLMLREYTIPVVGAELLAILVALRDGLIGWLKQTRPPRFVLVALGALVAIAIGTAFLVAPNTPAAILRTGLWILHLLFGVSVGFLCTRQFDAGDLSRGYLAGFAVFSVAFVIFVMGAFDRPLFWRFDLPAFVHIRHLAIYAAALGSFAIGMMAAARTRATWAWAFVLTAVGFGLSLWSGARGAALSPVAATFAGLLFIPSMRAVKVWGGMLLALAIGTAAAAVIPVPPSDMMGLGRTVTASTTGEVTTGRVGIWKGVAAAVREHPVFGYGEGQMPTVAPYDGMGQPHNLFLQILLAWGVAGLACAGMLAVWFLREAIPRIRSNDALIAPFLAMAALFALSMLDAALYHVLPVSIFAACAGMIASSRRDEAHSS